MATNVPTLLVGLGGIGSLIVEEVYKRIPEDRKDLIAVHAFDTDINDINDREFLKDNVTQTSTNITVGKYLDNEDESVQEWFPHEIELLKRKTMTDGAGQIRCVSRLAYRSAMKAGKLDKLEQDISKMFKSSGSKNVSSVRVMIVSSLAGGTGAGIFLQTALYLREILEKQLDKISVIIRGAFLLPDVLVYTKTVPENQWDYIRTNAYACFKELDAITKSADRQSMGDQTVSIEFEYRPDQVDIEGRQEHIITKDHLPYDYCFLYDYLTVRGEQIENYNHYLDQMINTIYLQLFSPIRKKQFSVEDNNIRDLIGERGGNRYCGAGTSHLIYPYNDLIEYFALKWAERSLSNEWCKIDEDFEAEYRSYENDINAGVSRPEPLIENKYIELIKMYSSGININPFFSLIYRTTIIDDNGIEIDTKVNRFIDSCETFIERTLKEDNQLKTANADCYIDNTKLNSREHVLTEVEDMEFNLKKLQNKVFAVVHYLKSFIVNQIIGEDCNHSEGLSSDNHYRLNMWILKQNDGPLHPVAIRYFLYQLLNMLDEKIKSLNKNNLKLKKGIDSYQYKYKETYKKPGEIFETAEDKIRAALEQNIFSKIKSLKNELKEFTKSYYNLSQAQLKRLNTYSVDYLKELVFSELHRNCLDMLEDWAHYFRNLKNVQKKLSIEIEKRAMEHEKISDPTKVFILATRKQKEKMWELIRDKLQTGSKLSPEICKRIYLGQYKRFCSRRYNKQLLHKPLENINIEKQFYNDVLNWCRNSLLKHEELNINAISALKLHLEYSINDNIDMKDIISKVDFLAQPYINNKSNKAQSDAYWGINPECLRILNDEDINEFFGSSRESIIDDPVFSQYEIIRYRNLFGLLAEDIPSFNAGTNNRSQDTGSYFLAYTKTINKMLTSIDQIVVTPHLDKRWHLPAYLPDLNKKQVIIDRKRIEKAYFLGLIYGYLKKTRFNEMNIWECHTRKFGRRTVMIGGKKIENNFYQLYCSMFHNPALVDIIIENAERQRDNDLSEHIVEGKIKIGRHEFYKGCIKCPYKEIDDKAGSNYNIIDTIFVFFHENPNKDLLNLTVDLLKSLMLEIKKYYMVVCGKYKSNLAKHNAKLFIKELCNKSIYYKDFKLSNNYVYNRWQEDINQFIEEELKKE